MERQCVTPREGCYRPSKPPTLQVPDDVWREWDLWENAAIREQLLSEGAATEAELDALGYLNCEEVRRRLEATRGPDQPTPAHL